MESEPDNFKRSIIACLRWCSGMIFGGMVGIFLGCVLFGEVQGPILTTAVTTGLAAGYFCYKWEFSLWQMIFEILSIF